MIVVTGAAGFIGSCLVWKLNHEGHRDLVLVDDFSTEEKNLNLVHKQYELQVHRKEFPNWLKDNHERVTFVFHLGARTDTTEFNTAVFDELNLHYSQSVWNACVEFALPLMYASSAATYGLGEHGYDDDHGVVEKLKPLNPYGDSKNDFDKWALAETLQPTYWAGIKFFNVYGPNESHKDRMASVVWHTFNQVKATGQMKLFRSHRPDYRDGEQLRDFVYVKDAVNALYYLMNHRTTNGLYNLGTGGARSFSDLATATFRAMGVAPEIEFIDTPIDIRDKYQYFTQANMSKLVNHGFRTPFMSLEDGIEDYVQGYLMKGTRL